jgi:DNA-binding NtrC family response regulator
MSPRPEEERILEALEKHQWNRRKVSEVLGMSYQTLRRRIEKYGLDQRR